MEHKKIILVCRSKGRTVNGDPYKLKCFIHEDGVLVFQKFVLIKNHNEEITFFKKLTTKFGSTLYVQEFGFKYSTFMGYSNVIEKKVLDNIFQMTTIL